VADRRASPFRVVLSPLSREKCRDSTGGLPVSQATAKESFQIFHVEPPTPTICNQLYCSGDRKPQETSTLKSFVYFHDARTVTVTKKSRLGIRHRG
jgi:hypothetical protein